MTYRWRNMPQWIERTLQITDFVGEGIRRLLSCFSDFWKQGKAFPEPNRILIIRCDYIGDLLLTTPALLALRRRFPNAHITVLAQPAATPILRANPNIEEVISLLPVWLDRNQTLPYHDPKPLRRWLGIITWHWRCCKAAYEVGKQLRARQFDLAIDFRGDPRHALLMAAAKIPVRIGCANGGWAFLLTHPVPSNEDAHEIDRCLGIIQVLGADTEDRKPFLKCFREDELSVREKLRHQGVTDEDLLVVIHPSAGDRAREWNAKAWAKVADALIHGEEVKVVLNGTAGERPKIEAIKTYMREKAIDLCGQLTLSELISLLKRCDLLLTVNSGPMHIAAVLGTPMVVVWAASWRVQNWGPYGHNHIIIQKQVPCANCWLAKCPKPISCMDMIEPEEVIDAAIKKLQEIKAIKKGARKDE